MSSLKKKHFIYSVGHRDKALKVHAMLFVAEMRRINSDI